MTYRIKLIILLSIGLLMFSNCGKTQQKIVPNESDDQLTVQQSKHNTVDNNIDQRLEMPKFNKEKDNVIVHLAYVVNYNSQDGLPYWVAYALEANETDGDAKRTNRFLADPNLTPDNNIVQWYDYKNSCYDRGHMAPAGDMKWSNEAMEQSFYMTNVCPQDSGLNHGRWNDLEKLVRKWAKRDSVVYVVCGPIVEHNAERIGEAKNVSVPKGFFKVLLRQHNGEWQAIAFYFDNKNETNELQHYTRSVDEIEQMTGFDFFHNLDDEIENKVEATNAPTEWGFNKH
ncbi:MAG: DNA/RNA non-specific endonuclease [Bacteroidales bacterium]|nr:DNA/RNA non-specific endonuclease [Bacteroidales bacterium]